MPEGKSSKLNCIFLGNIYFKLSFHKLEEKLMYLQFDVHHLVMDQLR